MSSTQKYIWMGTGAILLAGAMYWLSIDHEEAAFDPELHTAEKLRVIVNDIFVEGATLYCQKMNAIRMKRREQKEEKEDPVKFKAEQELKEKEAMMAAMSAQPGQPVPPMPKKKEWRNWEYYIDELKDLQATEMAEAEKGLYVDHGISEPLFEKWYEKNKSDPAIVKILERLEKLGESVLCHNEGCQKMEHVKCDNIPEGLDEDTYVLVFRKTKQIMRYKAYQVMEGGKPTNEEESKQLMDKLDGIFKDPQVHQKEALEVYGINIEGMNDRQISSMMRQVYLDYYSKSLIPENASNKYAYSINLNKENREHEIKLEKIFKDPMKLKEYDTNPADVKETIQETTAWKFLHTTPDGTVAGGKEKEGDCYDQVMSKFKMKRIDDDNEAQIDPKDDSKVEADEVKPAESAAQDGNRKEEAEVKEAEPQPTTTNEQNS